MSGANESISFDTARAAGPYKDVLVVVGHSDDFVRHDLAEGEDQIESPLNQQVVHLSGPIKVQLAL